MNHPVVKTVDVFNFIKDMVEMTMVFEIDDDGYVIKKSNGERLTLNEGGEQRPLLVYQETIKDQNALVINPLAENLMTSNPSTLWFFNTQRTALLGRIFTIYISVIKTALEEKKSKADKSNHIPMELLNIASKIIEDVDDRLLTEFTQLSTDSDTNEFITIYYQRKQLRSVLRCALFDAEDTSLPVENRIPVWKNKFPKIRKKSWEILERIMLAILHITDKDDILKFTRKAEEISCARLSSFLNVILSVYQEINPLLDIINPDIAIDLSKLAYHVNRLSAYTDNAKFMIMPSRNVVPTTTTQPTAIPGAMPSVPMATPAYLPSTPTPSPMNHPGATLVPGPSFVDGRQAPPTPVMAPGAYSQMNPYGQNNFQQIPQGGYFSPQGYQQPQHPYMTGYQPQQQYPYVNPNSIPFSGPYLPAQNYNVGSNLNNLNILPPGSPGGYNPNFR